MAWTADDLIAAVRRRAQLPDSAADGAVTDADILELANEELALRLVPLVRRSRGDYWVTTHDETIVSGTASYRVPERAQASGLRDLSIVDEDGREWPVPQMHLEDRGIAEAYGGGIGCTRFYMEGPTVVLVPEPEVSGYTLRMRYHRSHPTLVPLAESGTVFHTASDAATLLSAVATGATLYGVQLYPVPSSWVAGYTIDVYYRDPPFGFAALDQEISSVDSSGLPDNYVYTLTAALPSGFPDATFVNFGLMLASLSGETSIVDLPREAYPLLVSALTSRVCEVIGDRDAAQMAFALYERESQNVMDLLTPRVEGEKQVVIDRYSPLRRGGRRWR